KPESVARQAPRRMDMKAHVIKARSEEIMHAFDNLLLAEFAMGDRLNHRRQLIAQKPLDLAARGVDRAVDAEIEIGLLATEQLPQTASQPLELGFHDTHAASLP